MNTKQAEKRINAMLKRQTDKKAKPTPLRKYQNWGVVLDAYLEGYEAGKKARQRR